MPHYTFFSLSLSLSLYASFKLEHTLFLLSDFSFSVSNVFSTHTPNWYVNALTHSLTSKELHSLTLARSHALSLSLSLSVSLFHFLIARWRAHGFMYVTPGSCNFRIHFLQKNYSSKFSLKWIGKNKILFHSDGSSILSFRSK